MKWMKKTIVAALLAVVMVIPNSASVAANAVTVTLNGTALNYTLIQPTIINDRVMVPIRETAEYLGMTVDWNATTGTMTFTKDGNVITHTLHTNTITVNGAASTFDTPSQLINDRTVMPVRMLAESIDSIVDWDETTSTVIITKESVTPAISTVSTGTTTAIVGTPVMFNVVANSSTVRIQISNADTGALLATSSAPTVSGASSIFNVSYTPTTGFTEIVLDFLPIGSDGAAGMPEQYTLKGGGATSTSAQIVDVEVIDNTIRLNEDVDLTIIANNATEKVAVFDSNNTLLGSRSTYFLDGNNRVFALSVVPKRTGNLTLRVEAEGADGKKATQNFSVTVSSASSSSTGDTINDIVLDPDPDDEDFLYHDEIDATIYTDRDIDLERVWVEFNNDNNELDYDTSGRIVGDEYVWELTFEVERSGYYYFYTRDEDDDEEYERIYITVDGDSEDIESVKSDEDEYYRGEEVELTVETQTNVDTVWVEDEDGDELDYTTNYSSSGGRRLWTLRFDADYDGDYYVYSENDDGNEDDYRIRIYVID